MNIGVIIVTYNRLEKLKITLDLFEKQIYLPKYVLVVNNASTDGTSSYLESWKKNQNNFIKEVITTDSNIGGSGGFYTGLKASLELDADWIWVSDDDAYPKEDALLEANNFLKEHELYKESISAICSTVINNGVIDISHRRTFSHRGIKIIEEAAPEYLYNTEFFEINAFSYVGTIINKEKLKIAGLTNKDYFIWSDDAEHSLRLSKIGKILVIPKICVNHDTVYKPEIITWKEYYGIRNTMDMYKKHMPWYCFFSFYFIFLLKLHIKKLLKMDIVRTEMKLTGIRDFRKSVFGVHSIYRPGWKM